jgi:1-acyl-sn-glycerol-3-phosphate acyltransferase
MDTNIINNNIGENDPAGFKETRTIKFGYSLIRKILGPIIRKVWIEEIEGLENIPKDGPVIVASNHQSYFDFICFIAASPRKVHYLAAEKFYKSRVWRPVMNLTGQIKVDRLAHDKSEMYNKVYSALNQGEMIGIFPEGTRSSDGEIHKSFTGVAKFALGAKVPVLPVGIIGTYDIMSRNDKYPKLKKAKIKIGKPMYFHEYDNIQPADSDYRLVTDKIMSQVADLAEKKYNFGDTIIS